MSKDSEILLEFKLGDSPIACEFHLGDYNPKKGIFHEICHDIRTDEGNNYFAVTRALVEDEDGNLRTIDLDRVKLLRSPK